MGDIRKRLDRLDRLGLGPLPSVPFSGLAEEIRQIDETIHRLDREIAEGEAALSPEEVAESRRAHAEYMSALAGLSLEEKITRLDREIQGIRR